MAIIKVRLVDEFIEDATESQDRSAFKKFEIDTDGTKITSAQLQANPDIPKKREIFNTDFQDLLAKKFPLGILNPKLDGFFTQTLIVNYEADVKEEEEDEPDPIDRSWKYELGADDIQFFLTEDADGQNITIVGGDPLGVEWTNSAKDATPFNTTRARKWIKFTRSVLNIQESSLDFIWSVNSGQEQIRGKTYAEKSLLMKLYTGAGPEFENGLRRFTESFKIYLPPDEGTWEKVLLDQGLREKVTEDGVTKLVHIRDGRKQKISQSVPFDGQGKALVLDSGGLTFIKGNEFPSKGWGGLFLNETN